MIPEYAQVRIIRIEGDPAMRVISSSYDPPLIPQVGDSATVVDVQSAAGRYVVELVEPDARAKWVAWFHEAELERV